MYSFSFCFWFISGDVQVIRVVQEEGGYGGGGGGHGHGGKYE